MYVVKINNKIVSKSDFLHYERYNARIGEFFSSDRENGDRVCIETDTEKQPLDECYYANYDGKVFDTTLPMATILEEN